MLATDGTWWRDRAACADPAALPLVDAAYDSPGGPEAKMLGALFCRECPVSVECFTEAMVNGEAGVWGGTSPHTRSRHGGKQLALWVSKRPPQAGVA